MTRIEVDQSFQQKLGDMTDRLEFCDGEGRVIARYVPEAEYVKMLYDTIVCPLSEEEIARRISEPGGYTLQEIWKELGVE
jgi:hypothetical protein